MGLIDGRGQVRNLITGNLLHRYHALDQESDVSFLVQGCSLSLQKLDLFKQIYQSLISNFTSLFALSYCFSTVLSSFLLTSIHCGFFSERSSLYHNHGITVTTGISLYLVEQWLAQQKPNDTTCLIDIISKPYCHKNMLIKKHMTDQLKIEPSVSTNEILWRHSAVIHFLVVRNVSV